MTRARDLAAGTFEQATGGVLKLETSDTTVTDGSVLGKIEFKAPDEASGTDAILVGAAIEAVAEGTFAADNNATELVFKTGASAAADAKMTLTSGGNLLVGNTAFDHGDAGGLIAANGRVYSTVDGNFCFTANRLSSDGEIIRIQKDGSTVGSIGIQSSGFYIDGEANHAGIRFSGDQVTPRLNGSDDNGNIILGGASNRFKDLYLSGGVYLGGTGSANKLDDYEEGTWTPSLTFGGGSTGMDYGARSGHYTKVGNIVHATMYVSLNSKGSSTGDAQIEGLPFTSATGNSLAAGSISFNLVSFADFPMIVVVDNVTVISLRELQNDGTFDLLNNANFQNTSNMVYTVSYSVA